MKLLWLAVLPVAGALQLRQPSMATHLNPSGYEEITVAIENSVPNALELRRAAEERRAESKYLASLGESSFLKGPQDAATIELSLGAANNALPNLSATISNLEKKQASTEQAAVTQLTLAWNTAVSSANAAMSAAAGRALSRTSFLVTEPSVKVRAVGSIADAPADVIAAIADMEAKRDSVETGMIRQASADLAELGKVVSSEFEKALSSGISFLRAPEGFAKTLNVKVMPTSTSPVVAAAEAMEARRDSGEAALMGEILNLELRLVQILNKSADAILKGALARL